MSPIYPEKNLIKYGDQRRPWAQIFIDYMESIVSHPNYEGMPCTRDDEGKIDWIIPSNRKRGSKNWDGNVRRKEWWAKKAAEIGIPTEGKWISRVAKSIHPTGKKPCQTCGRIMEIAYVYPTARTLQGFNQLLPESDQLVYEDLLSIYEIVDHFFVIYSDSASEILAQKFLGLPANSTPEDVKSFIREHFVKKESRIFSPGAMSNPPDRLDGFHTYNLCCRSRQDTGRAKDNLRSYTDDRRAFEHWCEGDWAAANLLMTQAGMGQCQAFGCQNEEKLTADHVGPISLGFAHSPHFIPLCRSCNSAKNNRMSFADIQALLGREERNDVVTSWQATFLWELCKNEVKDDRDALLLSKLLRINQHHFLTHLYDILVLGMPDVLLQFLTPEWAFNKVEFIGLDKSTLLYQAIQKSKRNDTYAHSKASRMIRIAMDALVDYGNRNKRNIQAVESRHIQESLTTLQIVLNQAAQNPSNLRQGMLEILSLPSSGEERAIAYNRLFQGIYKPNQDYSYIRAALEQLMQAYSEVLFRRFERQEAVGWDD